jgi:tetratricopeptide (TPR) repeat protein
MSKMLALIHAGWSSIRSSVAQGRRTDALNRLTRLLARPDVPAPAAADAHRLAGELLTDGERYSEARRHLRAAAALEPKYARTYYLWGLAQERDPLGCDRRAALRFRKASTLAPGNALYRAAFGRAAVRCNRVKIGRRELLAAADVAPDDLDVVRVVVDGLLEADRMGTARRLLNKASFLCRDAAQLRELRTLVERVRFASARRDQRGERGTTRNGQDAGIATDGGRVVLPFIRIAVETPNRRGETVRRDVVSIPRPHFPRLRSRKADR